MKRIVLIRHAEAIKNLQNQHGGEGTKLTIKGREQSISFAKEIGKKYSFERVLYAAKPQCLETAEIIAHILNIPKVDSTVFNPISLGVLDGLSDSEVAEAYPSLNLKMQKWREGSIEICDLIIPNMEDKDSFYKRGEKMLSSILDTRESQILILTRSLLVLLTSILLKRNTSKGGNYREIKWRNLDYAIFSFEQNEVFYHISASTIRI